MNKNGTSGALDDRMGRLKDSVRNLVDAGGERASTHQGAPLRREGRRASTRAARRSAAFSALVKEHPIAAHRHRVRHRLPHDPDAEEVTMEPTYEANVPQAGLDEEHGRMTRRRRSSVRSAAS